MAFFIFLIVIIVGIARHGLHFLSFFVPQACPWCMLLLLVPIEILSYLIRPFTFRSGCSPTCWRAIPCW